MRSHLKIYRLLPLLMLITLLAVTVVQAQDATVEATPQATVTDEATAEPTEAAAGGTGSGTVGREPVAGASMDGDISTDGLALGVLLLGLGAVALVGGLNWLRDNYRRPEESE